MAKRAKNHDDIPAVEWITGLVGLAIVVGTLGFVGYEALQGGREQPRLHVVVERTSAGQSGVETTVAIGNESRTAAAEVLVEGVLHSGDGADVRSEVRLDYVPGQSTRRATLVFPAGSDRDGVAVRIIGYTTP